MARAKWMAAACAVQMLALAGPGYTQDAGKVRVGQIGLSFYAVTAGVVQEVLERLGHPVEVTTGSHAQIFPKLGAGEVDLLVAAWLPHGHALYWQQYGARAQQLGVLYQGARFEWMVPAYVPPAEVSSVDDLRKPEVLARMQKIIQGTGRDSANMMLSAQVMEAYGLERAGYRLQQGTLGEFHGAYDRLLAEGKWFVMPSWRPHYINRLGTMRAIVEPRRLLGPASDGTLVASREWAALAPPRTLNALHRVHLGLDAVAEMDRLVNVEKMTPREAARAWMQKHRDQVDTWFVDF